MTHLPVPGVDAGWPADLNLLVVSGLSPVEADPWQAWMARRLATATWVRPLDGDWPDLQRWAQRIEAAIARGHAGVPWVAIGHGFGALALAHHAAHALRSPMAAVLLAPACPERFGQDVRSLGQPLPYPTQLVALQGGDHPLSPWLQDAQAREWAASWGSRLVDAGAGPRSDSSRWAEGEAVLQALQSAGLPNKQTRFRSLAS